MVSKTPTTPYRIWWKDLVWDSRISRSTRSSSRISSCLRHQQAKASSLTLNRSVICSNKACRCLTWSSCRHVTLRSLDGYSNSIARGMWFALTKKSLSSTKLLLSSLRIFTRTCFRANQSVWHSITRWARRSSSWDAAMNTKRKRKPSSSCCCTRSTPHMSLRGGASRSLISAAILSKTGSLQTALVNVSLITCWSRICHPMIQKKQSTVLRSVRKLSKLYAEMTD